MYAAWILAAAFAVACAEVSPFGYSYKAPLKPFGSTKYYSQEQYQSPTASLSGYPFGYSSFSSTPFPLVSSTVSPPVVSSINSGKYSPYLFGSQYVPSVSSSISPLLYGSDKYYSGVSSTISPLYSGSSFLPSSTVAPPLAFDNSAIISSTPSSLLPLVDNSNIIASTPAPSLLDNSNLFVSSTPAPPSPLVDDSNLFFSSTPAPPLSLVDNSNLFLPSTPAPFFGSSPALYSYGDISSTISPLVVDKNYESQFYQVQQPPEVYKHFYVHAAPEEPELPKPKTPIVLPPAQKHYNVIFVKTPNVSSRTSAIVPVQPQKEEKTIVYVLTKKPEERSEVIVPKVEEKPPTKPEVFFVKYENKQDSDVVIKNIVDQYNNKPGETVSFASGASIAPVAAPTLAPAVVPTIAPVLPSIEPFLSSTIAPIVSSSYAPPIVSSSFGAPTLSSSYAFPTYSTPYFAPTTIKPWSLSSDFSSFSSFPGYSSGLYTFPKRNGFSIVSGLPSVSGSSSSLGSSGLSSGFSSIFSSGTVPSSSGSAGGAISGANGSGSTSSILSDSNAAGSSSVSSFGSQSGSELVSEPVVNIGGQQTYNVNEPTPATLEVEAKEEIDSPQEILSEPEESGPAAAPEADSDDGLNISSNEGVPQESYGPPSSDDE